MKFTHLHSEIIDHKHSVDRNEYSLDKMFEYMEQVGRICHRSFENSNFVSPRKFIDKMIERKELSVLEHGTVYLKKIENVFEPSGFIMKYENNPYSKVIKLFYNDTYSSKPSDENKMVEIFVTTNYRVIIENGWKDDLKYFCYPSKHERRVSVLMHCDRITGESFLRHRSLQEIEENSSTIISPDDEGFSYMRESTRYCNFSKEKFGNNVTFVVPECVTEMRESLLDENEHSYGKMRLRYGLNKNAKSELEWLHACDDAEKHYFALLKKGWKPQNARYALGFSIYSPLVMTGFVSDWMKFFELRCSTKAHPDACKLATETKNEMIEKDLLNFD